MTTPDQSGDRANLVGGGASTPRRMFAALMRQAREIAEGQSDRTRTQRSALVVFAIRIASAAIAFASQAMLARWMGSFEYGIFVFVWVWVLILSVISSAGLNVAFMRFLPQYTEEDRLDLLRGMLLRGRLIIFVLATFFSAFALGLLWLVPDLFAAHYMVPAFIVFFCVPVIVLTDAQDCIGRAYSWMRIALIPPYILRPLLLLVAMAIAAAAGMPLEATTAAVCALISAYATFIIQTFFLQRQLRATVPPGPRAYDTRFWLIVALPILFVEGIDLLLYNTDVLLISHFMTPSDAGIYFASLKTIGLVSFVHYAVGSSIANRISALRARGDRAGLEQFVRDAAQWTFWPSLVAIIGLLIVGKPLLWLFGPEFTSGYVVMVALAVGILLRSAVGPAEFVMNMMGEQRTCAAVLGCSLVLNIVLNVLLIPSFGLLGAAIATSLSRVAASLLFYAAARRRLGLDISIISAFRSAKAAA
ncbi:MAG: polysaccharide biosynthesis C-terminal domain-containing protein [Pseudomonadota bacterium]